MLSTLCDGKSFFLTGGRLHFGKERSEMVYNRTLVGCYRHPDIENQK